MILRLIYRLLLRLRPKLWREEMLGVFDEARRDARSRGWLAYTAFGSREIGGLLRVAPGGAPGSRWRWGWPAAGLVAGLLAGWAGTLVSPEMYTSRAIIRVVPSDVPEHYLQAVRPLNFRTIQGSMFPRIYARTTIQNWINTYDLYKSERARMPLEDVVEIMQKQMDIRPDAQENIRVSFSYPDPILAQKLVRELMTRLIDETTRLRLSQSQMTRQFLMDQAERAASAWEELSAKARLAGPGAERRQLDRDLARRRYETLRQQVVEAEMILDLEERKVGPTVEVLDLPSLPEEPQLSGWVLIAVAGFAGLILGTLAGWLRRLRRLAASDPAIIRA